MLSNQDENLILNELLLFVAVVNIQFFFFGFTLYIAAITRMFTFLLSLFLHMGPAPLKKSRSLLKSYQENKGAQTGGDLQGTFI